MSLKKSGGKAEKNKIRFLNIIYFVDDSKTHSFKISLKWLNMVLVFTGFIFLWSLFATFALLGTFNSYNVTLDKLKFSLETIFEYQSKYDSVYELAYPSDKGSDTQLAEVAPAPHSESEEVDSHIEFGDADGSIVVKTDANNWPVDIENPVVMRDKSNVELNFAIKNKISPQKTEGFIWAVAVWKDTEGKKHFLGSPQGIKINKQGLVIDAWKNANTYSIRQYTDKNFGFKVPESATGFLNSIEIWMMDKAGKTAKFDIVDESGPQKFSKNTEIPPTNY
ncbi:MAG: hypothetical protein HYW48_06360 [Deltaproteobacteria bacterium]|nr:hypothetical protein [Deltaproteobacteria bacterium]